MISTAGNPAQRYYFHATRQIFVLEQTLHQSEAIVPKGKVINVNQIFIIAAEFHKTLCPLDGSVGSASPCPTADLIGDRRMVERVYNINPGARSGSVMARCRKGCEPV